MSVGTWSLWIPRVRRVGRRGIGRWRAWARGLIRTEPCYYLKPLDADSVVLDCGLGNDADFSIGAIRRFGCKCYGFDPTAKHRDGLRNMAEAWMGLFAFFPLAIAGTRGIQLFYESREEISGSLFSEHGNIRQRDSLAYEVECVTLLDVCKTVGVQQFDLVKLDIEGGEYEVLDGLSDEFLRSMKQLIVEFHHGLVDGWERGDTLRRVARLQGLGFEVFTVDDINYLFYQSV